MIARRLRQSVGRMIEQSEDKLNEVGRYHRGPTRSGRYKEGYEEGAVQGEGKSQGGKSQGGESESESKSGSPSERALAVDTLARGLVPSVASLGTVVAALTDGCVDSQRPIDRIHDGTRCVRVRVCV